MTNFPEYIECDITMVSIESSASRQNVMLRIVDHQGEGHHLLAESVGYFSLETMRLRNIVETVSLYDSVDFHENTSEVEEKIFYLLQGRQPEDKDRGVLFNVVSKLMNDIAHGRKVLLEIVSLYGADLLLLAEKVSIIKPDSRPIES